MSRHGYKRPTLSFVWYWLRTWLWRALMLAIFLVIAPTVAVTIALVSIMVALTLQTISGGIFKADRY